MRWLDPVPTRASGKSAFAHAPLPAYELTILAIKICHVSGEAGAGGPRAGAAFSIGCCLSGRRRRRRRMGGGGDVHHHGADGDFRTKVWTMTGGPYCRPKHWKRNTAIAMFGIFLVCIPIAMKSAELEGFRVPDLRSCTRSLRKTMPVSHFPDAHRKSDDDNS
ncbi:hypothetical protein ACLOJK_010342 [Asimina triloba]